MNKEEFLLLLKKRLAYLSNAEVQRHLDFYEEAINDRMDDGMDEYQAVKDLGELNDIVDLIKEEDNEKKTKKETIIEAKEKVTEKVVEKVSNVNLNKVSKSISKVAIIAILTGLIIFCGVFLIFGLFSLIFSLTSLNYNSATLLILFAQTFGSLGLGLLCIVPIIFCFKLLKLNKGETE